MNSAVSSTLDYLFGAATFMPHGACLAWRTDLVALHAVSDVMIAGAYFTIPLALFVFMRKRHDLEFRGVFAMFAVFILACGATHLMGLLTLWQPVYGLQGIVKAMTALVSVGTAAMLWSIIPRALALPSPSDLQREIERREQLELDIRQREQFMNTMFDNLPNMVFVKDVRTGTYTRINKASLTILGLSPDDVIGKTDSDIFPPTTATAAIASDKRVVETREQVDIPEEFVVHPSGDSRIIHTRKVLIPNAHGDSDYLLGISEDVTQQVAYRDALIDAKENAEIANRSKSEFLAHMSHELRTPLNAVMGFSQSITAGIFGPIGHARYAEYADHICKSAEHLLSVINDILDIAKIEAKKDELYETEFDVASTLESAVTITKMLSTERSQSLNTKIDADLHRLYADERMVRQILVNLIGNAVKFTPERGTISVEAATSDDGGVVVSVVDTGCGIPPEDIQRVMRPFEQVRSESFHTANGTGLGLSLSKAIVERHGGRLDIQSQVGVGTTVSATFPPERNRG